MSEIIKTKALVVRATRWQESSKIVTFFTETEGLVKLIVRGALRNKSPLAGKLETLSEVCVVFYRKDTRSLQLLKELDMTEPHHKLRTDYGRYPFALAILELISAVLEDGHKDAVFFNFVMEMISAVEKSARPAGVLIFFMLKLTSYLGFKAEFTQCHGGKHPACLKEHNIFSLNEGKRVCTECYRQGGLMERFDRDELIYLQNLQKSHYRRIHSSEYHHREWKPIIGKLLRYINLQMETHIALRSFEMIL